MHVCTDPAQTPENVPSVVSTKDGPSATVAELRENQTAQGMLVYEAASVRYNWFISGCNKGLRIFTKV